MSIIDELKENVAELRTANDLMLDDCVLLASLVDEIRVRLGNRMEQARVEGDTFMSMFSRTLDSLLEENASLKEELGR